jgi:hypothetical protein
MKRIWLKNGESWLYAGSLDADEQTVRFVDNAGRRHTLARADVASVALDSGGAHPDDDEVVQLLAT